MIKLYAIVAMIAAILGVIIYIDQLAEKAKYYEKAHADLLANYNTLKENQKQNDLIIGDYLTQIEAAKNETKKLDGCIASGKCVRRVLVKSACNLPKTESTTATEATYAELSTEAGRIVSDLRNEINENQIQCNALQKWAIGVSE